MSRGKRVALVFGTRPEAIKVAPIALRLRESTDFDPILIATAQHRELMDQVLGVFGLEPDYDLDIMRPAQNPFDVTERVLARLRPVLERERPDWVVVQGDTTTAFASALVAFYLKLPVAHVEAGLRTDDKYHPFPEEINRRLISALADLHFAPTQRAARNLLREGVRPDAVRVTGNTVIDALLTIAGKPAPPLPPFVEGLGGRRLMLATAHRRENWGDPMRRICRALRFLVKRHSDVVVAFSVHPNPQVRSVVEEVLGDVPRVHLLDPLDYVAFVHLMERSYLILTDSGGIQEEAPSLGKPVLVLREVTERPEGVEAGVLKVVGTDEGAIITEASLLLEDDAAYRAMAQRRNPYGDGRASERIVEALR
ncbi:MAG: UDP-N-acetylglucosamine 2-epimerase (non-hydrolyzing) [Anaerolineae bacterium]|nr:UDP-N-acetylglucosamine 2-epimerase (non-hydrolyzing) [Anaerolineae bacterium]